ncbi:hypothetical protein [Flavobacterium sp. Root186]|uniref:hypothetical protein n=1 Tax=Flavobacterium sp. Root186 TaxID=1736485 RepID=UPI0006FD31A1|nr:hypothetical protein [Flavobacterium sp. Root186]KRB57905.1 hypothetical protein ASD98_06455 [Flavobacterium sp. Root186]
MTRYLNLYAFCKIIEGKENFIICDFQKKSLKYIPDTLVSIINLLQTTEYEKVREQFSDQKAIFNSYVDFLISGKFAFFSDYREPFTSIENDFETPEIINNSIIEYNFESYDLNKALKELDELYTKYVEIRLLSYKSDNLEELADTFEKCKSYGFRSIVIYIPYLNSSESAAIHKRLKNFGKIFKIIFYNSPEKNLNVKAKNMLFIKHNAEEIRHNNFNEKNIIIDLRYYFESQKKNPYYNKKVCIDNKGTIKNCIKNKSSFGNIATDNISAIINKDDFQEFWNISHDQIINLQEDAMRYNRVVSNDLKKVSNNIYELIF